MYLVMLWLRKYEIEGELVWQTDWGEEFGGSNPQKLAGDYGLEGFDATFIFDLLKEILPVSKDTE
jgi:hypothetical protein